MGRQLDGLTRLFAALVPTLVVGCGDDPIDESQFEDDLCDAAGLHMLEAIEAEVAFDAVLLRDAEAWETNDDDEPVPGQTYEVDAFGELCAAASDVAACEAAIAAIPAVPGFSLPSFDIEMYRALLYTNGDEIGVVTNLGQLEAFLGAIDAPGDAALLGNLSRHYLICEDGPDVGPHAEGFVLFTRSGGGCGESDDIEHHVVLVREDGTIEVLQTQLIERGDPGCSVGRLPNGLCRVRRARHGTAVGAFMAEVAELEAGSVAAFEQLSRELVLHGAPRALVRASVAAGRDEIRHARVTAALARRFGGRPRMPVVTQQAPRSLVDVAVDNAIEGCIRETFGAASAHLMARQARDPAMRRAMARIAIDETRHAALSWSAAEWMESRMSVAQRREVARRRADAVERLEGELTADAHAQVHAVTGLPSAGQAKALYRGLARALPS